MNNANCKPFFFFMKNDDKNKIIKTILSFNILDNKANFNPPESGFKKWYR